MLMSKKRLESMINDFKNTNIYKEIKDDVILILKSGSLSQNIIDERSDVDLHLIYDEEPENKYDLSKDGKPLQLYYSSMDFINITDFKSVKLLDLVGGAQLWNMSEDKVIYVDKRYSDYLENLIDNRKEISSRFIYGFFERLKYIIDSIVEDGQVKEENYTKFIYHLIWMSHVIEGTDKDVDRLTRIKRIRWTPIGEGDEEYIVERMKYIATLL